jgi:teichoic acid transport system ATP-binding protein
MNKNSAIKVSNLTKTYKLYDKPSDRIREALNPFKKMYHTQFDALSNVNFEISKGETIGIIGKNGSGKSSLLKIISGVLHPTVGNVSTRGNIASLLELGAGFDIEMTGIDNVYLSCSIMGFSKSEIDSKINEIIAFADIGDFIYQPVKIYSSGMFVRLAFSTQIAIYPDILIVDEALAVGDSLFVHKCMSHFHKLKERGVTILLVTHDVTAIRTLCDKTIWLKDGCIEDYNVSSLVVDKYLQYISNQQRSIIIPDNIKDATIETLDTDYGYHCENSIPNIDDRFGNDGCRIIGFGFYDENMVKTTSISNDSTAFIKLSFINNNIDVCNDLVVGYIFRNSRGVDIASSNSEIEVKSINPPEVGKVKTIMIEFVVPIIHPGSYSISTSLGYRSKTGEHVDLDSIVNIETVNIRSTKLVHVLMSFKSKFTNANDVLLIHEAPLC